MRRERGFVLVEMLMVIAMIAILAAILFPVFAKARERARAHSCLTNQANIMLAIQLYADDHEGRFPPAEDDLTPLVERYLRNRLTFECPSSHGGVPMGAPANPDLYSPENSGPGMMGMGPAPSMMQGPPVPPEGDTSAADEPPPLLTWYYYRAGHRRDEAPSAPVLSDQDLHHSNRANVVWSDGHARRVGPQEWHDLDFRPIDELWPPGGQNAEAEGPEMGSGMGGGA
jgi:prepilin-type N-terminal cleavage/methylation domain-containing protein/prepilin-type processing-associated H-X9-DG protein